MVRLSGSCAHRRTCGRSCRSAVARKVPRCLSRLGVPLVRLVFHDAEAAPRKCAASPVRRRPPPAAHRRPAGLAVGRAHTLLKLLRHLVWTGPDVVLAPHRLLRLAATAAREV